MADIKIGQNQISKLYLGEDEVTKLFIGEQLALSDIVADDSLKFHFDGNIFNSTLGGSTAAVKNLSIATRSGGDLTIINEDETVNVTRSWNSIDNRTNYTLTNSGIAGRQDFDTSSDIVRFKERSTINDFGAKERTYDITSITSDTITFSDNRAVGGYFEVSEGDAGFVSSTFKGRWYYYFYGSDIPGSNRPGQNKGIWSRTSVTLTGGYRSHLVYFYPDDNGIWRLYYSGNTIPTDIQVSNLTPVANPWNQDFKELFVSRFVFDTTNVGLINENFRADIDIGTNSLDGVLKSFNTSSLPTVSSDNTIIATHTKDSSESFGGANFILRKSNFVFSDSSIDTNNFAESFGLLTSGTYIEDDNVQISLNSFELPPDDVAIMTNAPLGINRLDGEKTKFKKARAGSWDLLSPNSNDEQAIDLGVETSLFNSDFTIDFWVKFTDITNEQILFSSKDSGIGPIEIKFIPSTSGAVNTLAFSTSDGSNSITRYAPTNSIAKDIVYNITFRYDLSTITGSILINTDEVLSTTFWTPFLPTENLDHYPLRIGSKGSGGGSPSFKLYSFLAYNSYLSTLGYSSNNLAISKRFTKIVINVFGIEDDDGEIEIFKPPAGIGADYVSYDSSDRILYKSITAVESSAISFYTDTGTFSIKCTNVGTGNNQPIVTVNYSDGNFILREGSVSTSDRFSKYYSQNLPDGLVVLDVHFNVQYDITTQGGQSLLTESGQILEQEYV